MITYPTIKIKKKISNVTIKPNLAKLVSTLKFPQKKPNGNLYIKNTKTQQPTKKHTVDPRSLLSGCNMTRKYSKRMIGGETMRLNEFPWMALLEYEKCEFD